MSRHTFGVKDKNRVQPPSADRFVPPRSSVDELRSRHQYRDGSLYSDIDNFHITNYFQRKRYTQYLDEALGLGPKMRPSRMLQTNADIFKSYFDDFSLQPWPCVPRKKKCLTAAAGVLDLPSFNYETFSDLLDWGKQDVLIAAFNRTYYTWSWKEQALKDRGHTTAPVHACKFEPNKGETIAFGTLAGVEVHDGNRCKLLSSQRCPCGTDCVTTCLDWSPTGKSFATGCNHGFVTGWDVDVNGPISHKRVDKTYIHRVCISPDARYIACKCKTNVIRVFLWPTIEVYCTLTGEWIVTTMSWHPWRSSMLHIGASSLSYQPTLAFWSAASDRFRPYYITSLCPSCIDCSLFNNITGELVMSFFAGRESAVELLASSSLLVLSDPFTVVDMWDFPKSGNVHRVKKMMFSPDGTKLASGTTEEDLLIWNFLSESEIEKKKKRKLPKFSALPTYLDKASWGRSFR